jgi:hypothetical protein
VALSVAVALAAGAAGGFMAGRSMVEPAEVEERKPNSAPIELERRCDEAGGIWIDLEEAYTSPLVDHLPGFARVPGCYRQIGAATAFILDLSYSGEWAREWAESNGLTQDDLIEGL